MKLCCGTRKWKPKLNLSRVPFQLRMKMKFTIWEWFHITKLMVWLSLTILQYQVGIGSDLEKNSKISCNIKNCESLYQFYFGTDWRGCNSWFHNHTIDRKKFPLKGYSNPCGKIPKNGCKVWTLNVLPFKNIFILFWSIIALPIHILQFQHLIDKVFHNWTT